MGVVLDYNTIKQGKVIVMSEKEIKFDDPFSFECYGDTYALQYSQVYRDNEIQLDHIVFDSKETQLRYLIYLPEFDAAFWSDYHNKYEECDSIDDSIADIKDYCHKFEDFLNEQFKALGGDSTENTTKSKPNIVLEFLTMDFEELLHQVSLKTYIKLKNRINAIDNEFKKSEMDALS